MTNALRGIVTRIICLMNVAPMLRVLHERLTNQTVSLFDRVSRVFRRVTLGNPLPMRSKLRFSLPILALIALPGLAAAVSQAPEPPFNQCPAVGQNSSCGILILIDTDGSLRIFYDPSQGPYDGIEDTLVGVQNNSKKTIQSIPLYGGTDLFDFDGDGICGIDPNSPPDNPQPFNPRPAGCPFGPTGYEGPGVTLSAADSFNGTVSFAKGLAPGASAYFSLEGAIQSKCAAIQGVPLIKQGDSRWGNIATGGDPKLKLTIGGFGCYLTDAVMLINYYAGTLGVPFSTDPPTLNAWLIANKGYNKSGFIIPNAILTYANNNGVPLSYRTVDHRDDFVVDSLVCSQQPPFLLVGQPHWVVATGQTVSSGGFDTYLVNDPGDSKAYPNDDTLEPWAFDYRGIDIYTPSPGVPSGLYIFVHSPVDVYITAPNGQRKGVDPTTQTTYDEILGAAYKDVALVDDTQPTTGITSPPTKVLYLPHPADGAYSLDATGTGVGPYEIEISAYDINGDLSTAPSLEGMASTGMFHKYSIKYSSVAGSQVSVSVFADLNNDGKVDCLDMDIVRASFGKKAGRSGFDPRADVNGDGIVNVLDLAAVSRQLPAGTVCH
jgi:hypothetical protein